MKKCFAKLIINLSTIFILSSCAHSNDKNSNILSIENESMAAIVSGCTYDYQTKFITTVDSRQECIATWKNIDNGDVFYIKGYNNIRFVKPGIYEFISYKSKPPQKSSYTKRPNALSIFSKVNINAGEVLYIGNLNVNSKKSVHVLESMSFSYNQDIAKEYLNSLYPELVDRMKIYPITLSSEAEFVVQKVYNSKENKENEKK